MDRLQDKLRTIMEAHARQFPELHEDDPALRQGRPDISRYVARDVASAQAYDGEREPRNGLHFIR